MDKQKIVLLLCGGGGTEHEISLVSAEHIKNSLKDFSHWKVIAVEVNEQFQWVLKDTGQKVELSGPFLHFLSSSENQSPVKIDLVVPCFHGPPGETGQVQAYFDLLRIPYFGCTAEANQICFDKVNTKLWFQGLGIPTAPFEFLSSMDDANWEKAFAFAKKHPALFVKASHQGSSVGCYPVNSPNDLEETIKKAFQYSPYVLLEKKITGRELEISTYELNGQVYASRPGEILCPSAFYSYEEKYSPTSKTTTQVMAKDLSPEISQKMITYSIQLFKALKLRHLSRIDFFLSQDNEILVNEINTFPGMTSISLFPKMMEANGHSFAEFLNDNLKQILKNS